MLAREEKNKKIILSLRLFTILFCGIVLLCDISNKKGYHMDELLSFELANAEFNPWIVPTQPQGRLAKFVEQELRGDTVGQTIHNLAATIKDVCVNRGNSKLLTYQADVYEEPVWITAEEFKEYITVGKQDRFNYLSVYFNVKDDNHPPLHFMLLHTVCSMFPGKITPLMGCSVNLIFVLAMIWLIMELVQLLLELSGCREWAAPLGILAGALYGLSAGAMNTTLLIRMYAMVSFFCVASLLLHVKKYFRVDGCSFEKNNKLLGLVTVLGFWTQYFFLFYCLVLAAVMLVLLGKDRRIKEVIRYIRTMVLAAVTGLVGFPFAIQDVFSSERGTEALGNLGAGLSGYGTRLQAFGTILMQKTGWILLVFIIFILAGLVFHSKTPGRKAVVRWKLWGILGIPALGYFLLAARMSPYLVDRYIMPLFPICIILTVTGCGRLLKLRYNRKNLIGFLVFAGILSAAQLGNPDRYRDTYLYPEYAVQEAISEAYEGDACICVGEGVSYYGNLLEFTNYGKTLILTPAQLENRKDKASVRELDRVVVLLKNGLDCDPVSTILEEQYGMELQQVLQESSELYGDQILLYQKERE